MDEVDARVHEKDERRRRRESPDGVTERWGGGSGAGTVIVRELQAMTYEYDRTRHKRDTHTVPDRGPARLKTDFVISSVLLTSQTYVS